MTFHSRFTVTNAMTAVLTRIERVRGLLEAATLPEDWIRRMSERTLILEAHHTTHIEGTSLSLAESERPFAGEAVPDANAETTFANSPATGTRSPILDFARQRTLGRWHKRRRSGAVTWSCDKL